MAFSKTRKLTSGAPAGVWSSAQRYALPLSAPGTGWTQNWLDYLERELLWVSMGSGSWWIMRPGVTECQCRGRKACGGCRPRVACWPAARAWASIACPKVFLLSSQELNILRSRKLIEHVWKLNIFESGSLMESSTCLNTLHLWIENK